MWKCTARIAFLNFVVPGAMTIKEFYSIQMTTVEYSHDMSRCRAKHKRLPLYLCRKDTFL